VTDIVLPRLLASSSNHVIPSSGPITLIEVPSATCGETAAFAAHYCFANAGHRIAALAYARLLAASPSTCLTVTYKYASGQRVYAPHGAGQSLPKDVRLFFFGKDHFEIDMVAAQLHMLVSVSTGQPLVGLLSVAEFRHKLALDLSRLNNVSAPREFVKKFLNVALNVTEGQALCYLRQHYLFVPTYMTDFLSHLQNQKTRALDFAISKGFDASKCTTKNVIYFALEFLEQAFMRVFLNSICTNNDISSLVLIHDGVYIKPCPDDAVISVAINAACCALSIPTVPLRVVGLLNLWQQKYMHTTSRDRTHTNFNHDPSRAKRTAHTRTFVVRPTAQAKRKSFVLTHVEHPNNLLAYFKKRKLVP
jgi:hypothetical protein